MAGYAICSVERSGSTLYCELLEQTGVAGRPMIEPFNMKVETVAYRHHDFATYDAYLDFATRRASTPNAVFGINLMWRHLARVSARLQETRAQQHDGTQDVLRVHLPELTHFVFTQRRDVLAQAVSWAIAYQTDRWKSTDPDTGVAPSYDFALVDALYQNVLADTFAWETWFSAHSITPMRIFYEDLIEDPSRLIRQTLEFLDLQYPPAVSLAPTIMRQATEVNQIWQARYLEDKRLNNDTALPPHWLMPE